MTDSLYFFLFFIFFARVTSTFNAVVELVLWETWDLFLCVGGSNSKSIFLVGTSHLHILSCVKQFIFTFVMCVFTFLILSQTCQLIAC